MKLRPSFAAAFVVLVVLTFATVAGAQGVGRADPTATGRYLAFGSEHSFAPAKVWDAGPWGAKCGPADELKGHLFENSTKEGRAVQIRLTDKAQVAPWEGHILLCGCAGGKFNELFAVDPSTAPPLAPPVAAPAPPAPVAASLTAEQVAAIVAAAMKGIAPVEKAKSCSADDFVKIMKVIHENGRKNDLEVVCEDGSFVLRRFQFKHESGPGASVSNSRSSTNTGSYRPAPNFGAVYPNGGQAIMTINSGSIFFTPSGFTQSSPTPRTPTTRTGGVSDHPGDNRRWESNGFIGPLPGPQ